MDDEARRVIGRWIAKAEHDLTTARVVLEHEPEVTDTVCFYAQQCVEKALKAYLTLANVHVEKTHHLPYLLDQCSAIFPPFEEIRPHARALTDYAVEARYVERLARDSQRRGQERRRAGRRGVGLRQTAAGGTGGFVTDRAFGTRFKEI